MGAGSHVGCHNLTFDNKHLSDCEVSRIMNTHIYLIGYMLVIQRAYGSDVVATCPTDRKSVV